MPERELSVFANLRGNDFLVGRLWAHGKTSAFAYSTEWLSLAEGFDLSPALPRFSGTQYIARPLPGAFTDCSPDSWGKTLMRRAERKRADDEGSTPRTLFDVDFLAGVDDRSRMGALRFKDSAAAEDFLSDSGVPVPPLIELPRLLSAAERLDKGKEKGGDIALVLAPGASLGGARPKATIVDKDGSLLVAKFPRESDSWPLIPWEAIALSMAEKSGITVPTWRLQTIANKPVLLLKRFDRAAGGARIPFMSAMTALDAEDHGGGSYLDILEFIRQHGASPDSDYRELFRRIAFNVLVSNVDDHLRNHAFLRTPQGWRLSPAYDMNPNPHGQRIHVLSFDGSDKTGSIDLVFSIASKFGLKKDAAWDVIEPVAKAVMDWRTQGKALRLNASQLDFMSTAYEHGDLDRFRQKAAAPKGGKGARNPKASKPNQPPKRRNAKA